MNNSKALTLLNSRYTKALFIVLAIACTFTTPAISLFTCLIFALTIGNPYTDHSKISTKKLLQ